MWYSPSASAQMEERVRGDDKKRDDDDFATDNADSGFLSAGNMQISGEIRDSQTKENRRTAFASRATISTTTSSSSSSSSSPSPTTTTVVADETMRVTDSGIVDVDLSEGLNHLSLRQSSLNPLSIDKDDLIQSEPTMILQLTPVKTEPIPNHMRLQHQNDLLFKRHQQNVKKCMKINENDWQLYCMQDNDGDTQLHIAIMQGYVEAALVLIKLAPHPCLLNTYNDDWQSPLHLAVLTSQPLIVRRLILAGADPSLRNFRGNTALHLTCMSGELACAKALTDPLSPMERNKLMPGQTIPALPQNLEQRNYNGKSYLDRRGPSLDRGTPAKSPTTMIHREMCLHLAAANGHVNLVRLLLRLGADLEAREALAGRTALHLAMEHGCRSVVNFLLQECKPCLDVQMYNGMTAYQLALCIDTQLARELLRYGAKPEPLPDSDSEGSSENNISDSSDDENYNGEASYFCVKMQNAVQVKV
ncbi:LOW QUALITY PROTEIN: NF-kappa-B inhibitor cactus-like [Pogonomyrmex barbatus]|uniref:LOW QUALITY PROTEIN: NF-kappa-B inhibitor cactus-like n=1 Tax=Pogonomyrmex barbatus TaxID=144034 RepID=A0A8N1SAM5_9HYME|nr:LOW QUALITY PROTEIN: NF-kappa-B inhibitor cactus-like [Pogonomyrmex barbatus]